MIKKIFDHSLAGKASPNFKLKDAMMSVLRIGSARNKEGKGDISIAKNSDLSNILWIETMIKINL